ncbi:MAG TPA: endonuclease III [Candidatus Latescibacteria bacterium]|nr:endonuclease III [Candidatus Latescibacterota bacterium]
MDLRAKVESIIEALEAKFGVPQREARKDPLNVLIGAILSQNTSDRNSGRAYQALRGRFPTWDDVLSAETDQIADTIRIGGLADQKARRIKDILLWIKKTHGRLNLDFICDMDPQDVIDTFCRLKGIGIKTMSVVLCFACGRDVFPVDTHILRVSERLGLVPPKTPPDKAHRILGGLVPEGKAYPFHLNLLAFGRGICKARDPKCEECPVPEYCLMKSGAMDLQG